MTQSPAESSPAKAPGPRRARRRRPGPPPRQSSRLYLRLAPRDIALFRFLLEAHDNLALFTVTDRRQAVLQLRFSPDQEAEVRAFLHRARREMRLEVVYAPEGPAHLIRATISPAESA